MNRITQCIVTVVISIAIGSFSGCNSVPKIEKSPSASDIIMPKQINISDQKNNAQSKDNLPSPTATSEIEYSDSLCSEDEQVLLSFKLENYPKTLSVCVLKTHPYYIVYRFGDKNKIELEFPDSQADSWSKFAYSYYFRGGGAGNEGMDLNYLSFENAGYKYEIYEEYIARGDITNIGIKIINMATNEETYIEGVSDSIEGSLIELRENEKIKIEILQEIKSDGS